MIRKCTSIDGLLVYRTVVAAISGLLLFASLSASAQEIDPAMQTVKLTLNVADKKKAQYCSRMRQLLGTHIRSYQWFDVVRRENSSFEISINCSTDQSIFRLDYTNAGATRVKISEIELVYSKLPSQEPEQVALTAMIRLRSELPFDGFVYNAAPIGQEASLGKSTRAYKGFSAVVGEGTITDPLMGNCLPMEIGKLAEGGDFKRIGYGVSIFSSEFGTISEIYVRREAKNIGIVIYRYMPPGAIRPRLNDMVEECKERMKLVDEGNFFSGLDFADFAVFEKEAVELNRVQQHGGGSILTATTTNDQLIDYAAMAYAYNRLKVGKLFAVTARVTRHLYTEPYNSSNFGDRVPEMTFAHGAVGLRLERKAHEFALGGGLSLDKINIPYFPNGKDGFTEREQQNRGIVDMYYAYHFTENWIATSFALAPSQTSPHAWFNIGGNIMLTNTWYFGIDFDYNRYGETVSGAPGITTYALGGHVGFALERDR